MSLNHLEFLPSSELTVKLFQEPIFLMRNLRPCPRRAVCSLITPVTKTFPDQPDGASPHARFHKYFLREHILKLESSQFQERASNPVIVEKLIAPFSVSTRLRQREPVAQFLNSEQLRKDDDTT